MRRLSAAIGLTATAFFVAPALAHHSMSMFDTSKEILIKGTVARLEWKNPHIYLIVETVGEDGKKQLIQGEGLAITQALVDGLQKDALKPGTIAPDARKTLNPTIELRTGVTKLSLSL